MTKPPCYDTDTNTDCPDRHVGCKGECERWKKWIDIHAQEKDQQYRKKMEIRSVDGFLSEQYKRHDRARRKERQKEREAGQCVRLRRS